MTAQDMRVNPTLPGVSDLLGMKCEIGTPDTGPATVPAWTRPIRKAPKPRTVDDVADQLANRRRRFDLTRVAGSCLHEAGAHWKDQHRTVWCHRGTTRREGETLPVYRQANATGARLAEVTTCGHGWTCPVCAAKITEQRRLEIMLGLERHCGQGGGVYLVSLTLPHRVDEKLADLVERLDEARKRLKNGKRWKGLFGKGGSAGCVGAITSAECTVGWNGWHPHLHMLVLANRQGLGEGAPNEEGDLSSSAIDSLRLEWVRLLLKVGAIEQSQASDVYRHGLNVRGGDKAAEYVAKYGEDSWGLSREIASVHAKIGVRGMQGGMRHFTPFQLLEIADARGDYSLQARAMFREFSTVFAKKRMLTWSPGLKTRLGISDLTDEEIAAELDKPAPGEEFKAGEVTIPQFQTLVRTNQLGAFLEFVARECNELFIAQDLIDRWIQRRADDYPARGSGVVLREVDWNSYVPEKYRFEEID